MVNDKNDLETPDSKNSNGSGNELQLEATLFPVDRYIPEKKLGQGALGSVYRCHDVHLDKTVAVKCLHLQTGDHIILFQEEARIVSRLNHEHVIKVFDFGTSQSGQPFMVLEYFAGRSLQEILAEKGKLSNALATEIFLQICSALNHLHKNKVFHRDLKPSNILVDIDYSGTPSIRLIDFGLSKGIVQNPSGLEVQGRTIVGTPAYMSPDQVEGHTFDAPSEVYSLGCVLYEMFAGRPPFVGDTAIEILKKHKVETPIPLTNSVPEISPKMSAIIMKCLQKDRRERYQSIAEILDDWHEVQLTGSTADTTMVPAAKRRWRFTAILALTLVGLLCIFSTILMVLRTTPQYNSAIRFESLPNRERGGIETESTVVENSLGRMKKRTPSNSTGSAADGRFPEDDIVETATNKDEIINSKADDKESLVIRFVCDDESIKKLAHRKSLKSLDISEGSVTDRVFDNLSALSGLSYLRLNRTSVRTLNGIEKLAALEQLELKNTAINDDSLSRLKALTKLAMLNVSATGITDSGVKNLVGLRNLRSLFLTSTLITPAVAEPITKLDLVRLSVAKTAVDAQTVRKIASMPSIDLLDINGCEKISREERLELERKFPTVAFVPKMALITKFQQSAERHMAKGDYRSALAELRQCASIVERQHGKDSPKSITINLSIGLSLIELKQYETAEPLLARTLAICEKTGNTFAALAAADRLAMINYSIDTRKGLAYATKALQIAEKRYPDPVDLAFRHVTIGDVLMREKRYKDAEAAYRKSMTIVEKAKGSKARELGRISIHLAESMRIQGKINDAATYYKKGIAILGNLNPDKHERFELCVAYTGLAAISVINGNFSEALKLNDKSVAYGGTIDTLQMQVVHYQRADILAKLGRSQEAIVERDLSLSFKLRSEKAKPKP